MAAITAVGLLSFLPAVPALALPSDREQPIRIESDRAERNEKAGTTIYIGDVNLRQGTLLIRSDRLEIHASDNQITNVIATGKPAYMEQQPKPEKPVVKARADTINYFTSNERVKLRGDASVEQQGSVVKSDIIDYFLNSELIKAHGGIKNPNQRVHVVIPASKVNSAEQARPGGNDKAPQPAAGQGRNGAATDQPGQVSATGAISHDGGS